MANYQLLKADIDKKVYQNGEQEITGANLNAVLNAMVTTLGAGYQFMGVATPDTNPGTPDQKVFYIVLQNDTYSYFDGIVVNFNEYAILKYEQKWVKESIPITTIAIEPTQITTDSAISTFYGHIIVGKNIIESVTGNPQKCYVFRAKQGDKIHGTFRQYVDTSCIAFTTTMPAIGDVAEILAIGTPDLSAIERTGQAPSDGYFILTEVQGDTYAPSISNLTFIENSAVGYNEFKNVKDGNIKLFQRYRPFFTINDFPDKTTPLNDIGIAAQITSQKQIIESKYYRYFWIAVKKGNTIHTRANGFTDNINIGFAKTMDVASITDIYGAFNGQTERVATAPSDGYFMINYAITSESGTESIPAYVWADLLKELPASINDYLFADYIQVIKDNPVIVTGGNIQKSLIYKVYSGDKISAKVKQYGDTGAIVFTKEKPAIGVSAQILSLGYYNGLELRQYSATAPEDGYVMITYRNDLENSVSDVSIISSVVPNRNTYNEDFRNISEIKKDIPDFRPMFNFTSAPMEAAGEMATWTGSQIIENIYEPLRAQYPNYITRKVIGKCSDGATDIWLYEFNNSVEEWFGLYDKDVFLSIANNDVLLPGTNELTTKQCAIRKKTFDDYFANKEYVNIYFLVDFPVRKLEMWETREESTFFDDTYYKFTFASDLKITTYQGTQNALELWWTKSAKTYDQHAMIISGIHADEPAGYLGTALALKYMIEHHAENPTLNYIFNNVKLSVIPIVNVWGSNQSPKKRTDFNGKEMNDWTIDNAEHTAISNYVKTIKDELSFFADFHTSELWNNYGYIYAIPYPHTPIYPAIVATANYLCRSWFPKSPAYNWNIGGLSTGFEISTKYIGETFHIPSTTVEFCGKDLMSFGNCERWSAKYMTYCVENFLNFIISLCAIRIKNNSNAIIENKLFERSTML